MDRKDFNTLGIGIDDLIDAYVQTVLSVVAIDKMCSRLMKDRKLFSNSSTKIENENDDLPSNDHVRNFNNMNEIDHDDLNGTTDLNETTSSMTQKHQSYHHHHHHNRSTHNYTSSESQENDWHWDQNQEFDFELFKALNPDRALLNEIMQC